LSPHEREHLAAAAVSQLDPGQVTPIQSSLPCSRITAEIANGVLKVTVQKPAPKQTKQIEIKSAT